MSHSTLAPKEAAIPTDLAEHPSRRFCRQVWVSRSTLAPKEAAIPTMSARDLSRHYRHQARVHQQGRRRQVSRSTQALLPEVVPLEKVHLQKYQYSSKYHPETQWVRLPSHLVPLQRIYCALKEHLCCFHFHRLRQYRHQDRQEPHPPGQA